MNEQKEIRRLELENDMLRHEAAMDQARLRECRASYKGIVMVKGLDRDYFAMIVEQSMRSSSMSYREIGDFLGLETSVFARIQRKDNVNVDTFLAVLHWVKHQNKAEWNSIMKDIFEFS